VAKGQTNFKLLCAFPKKSLSGGRKERGGRGGDTYKMGSFLDKKRERSGDYSVEVRCGLTL